jgi:hypothetical protein
MLDPHSKFIAMILLTLFGSDKIEDEFYDAIIDRMKRFTSDRITWIIELLDIRKDIERDVEGGINGATSEVREYIRQYFIRLLKFLPSKAIRKINTLSEVYSFSIDSLERMNPDNYTCYLGFVLFGCPWSTDIDVMVFCPLTALRDGSVVPLFSSEIQRLKRELEALGLDTQNRGIDISLAIVVDGEIVASSKGGRGTANIVLKTHHHHPQQMSENNDNNDNDDNDDNNDNTKSNLPLILVKNPLNSVELTNEDFGSNLRAFAKYCWDNMKYLVDKKTSKRMHDVCSQVHKNGSYVEDLHQILDLLVTDPNVAESLGLDMAHWRSNFKALTMKAVQNIVYFHEKTMSYTKAEIAEDSLKIAKYYEMLDLDGEIIRDGCLYNLTRGAKGRFVPELFDHLVQCYLQIVREVLNNEADQQLTFTCERIDLVDPDAQGGSYPGGLTYDAI